MEVAFQQGFASALLDVIFSRVVDTWITELNKIRDVDQNVHQLHLSVMKVRGLVRKVDQRDLSQFEDNEINALKRYFVSLTSLCYDVEDFMDKIALKIEKYSSESGKKTESFYRMIMVSPKLWGMPHLADELVEKVNGVGVQLESIINIMPNGSSNLNSDTPKIMEKNSVMQITLVGRDNDVRNIIDMLIQCDAFKGVSIVGMAGLGKTELARAIVNDGKTVGAFPNISWVSVQKNGCLKEEWLVNFVQDPDNRLPSSCNNKTLIIFDNLLIVTEKDWSNFLKAAGHSKRNVVFLITTRYPGISNVTSTAPYNLSLLSLEDCETMVRQQVEKMVSKQVEKHKEKTLEPGLSLAATTLASKCEGLPLVADFLSHELASRCSNWRSLLEEDLWEWNEFKRKVLPVLKSSYANMKSDVKKCFAFFSLFPWNHDFKTADMVQLWVGAGFIQQHNSSSRWDLNDLFHLNEELGGLLLVQTPDGATDTEMTRYQLSKFSYKIAQLAGSEACMRLDKCESASPNTVLPSGIRHLSIFSKNFQPQIWSDMKRLKRLSTILSVYSLENVGRFGKIPDDLFKSLSRIRVLALSNTDVLELPKSISKLKQLRFLDISNTLIKILPEKLCTLHSLQILKFKNTSLSRLPTGLHELRNLLCLDWDSSRLGLPRNIGHLVSLQNLPLYPVEQTEGRSVTELQNMNGLRGSIHIEKLENVKDEEEAKNAMLKKKSSLREITLQWNGSSRDSIARSVLNGLEPHISLEKLKITNYGGNVFPKWISHHFLRVEKIHLNRCRACNVLPALGQLPILKILILQDMRSLTFVDTSLCGTPTNSSGGHFPALQELQFKNMGKLESWRGLEANDMLLLRDLKLINCPEMVYFPSLENLTSLKDVHIELCQALESLSELPNSLESLIILESPKLKVECQDGGREWLRINSVPNVVIDYENIETGAKLLEHILQSSN